MRARPLPLLVEPETAGQASLGALLARLKAERARLDERIETHGALLLRGFAIADAEAFEAAARRLVPELMAYIGGDSPRRKVRARVYTSTEYPPDQEVRLHNELSYGAWWPERVMFWCARPAAKGGQTHIADGREVLARLDPAISARFADKGVRYLQTLPDAATANGEKSWQETFESDDRSAVEARCRKAGMQVAWTGTRLTTAIVRPGVLSHPQTGEAAWFNQADQWHRDLASVKHPGTGGTPGAHATYGDGSEIDPADLLKVRETLAACEVRFPWQAGDLLLLDNRLTLHGRKPFEGERRVLVAMG